MRNNSKEKLKRLIYSSQPVGFDDHIVRAILSSSRDNNVNNNITGALIYRQDLYLQFLEGAEEKVDQTYERIIKDTRHTDIHKLNESIDNRRYFASWAMRGDPVETWMWSHEEVKSGLMKKLSMQEALSVFERLSRNVDQFN